MDLFLRFFMTHPELAALMRPQLSMLLYARQGEKTDRHIPSMLLSVARKPHL